MLFRDWIPNYTLAENKSVCNLNYRAGAGGLFSERTLSVSTGLDFSSCDPGREGDVVSPCLW